VNVLDLYRRLPRTNCGLCAQKACMPFAVALAKGDVTAEVCPGLTEQQRGEIVGGSGKGDWRETVVSGLRAEVATLPFAELAPGLGAALREGALTIRCLGREYRVAPDGAIDAPGVVGPVAPWMRILLLHYVRTRGDAPPAGRWVAFTELKAALMKSKSFAREAEEPLRALFDRDTGAAERALERLGAVRESGLPAPIAWRLDALPRVPVLVLYWPAEEEFASKCKVLFDATADRYLDVESLTFLIEGLAKNIELGPDAAPHD
jgi:hypothetical protein